MWDCFCVEDKFIYKKLKNGNLHWGKIIIMQPASSTDWQLYRLGAVLHMLENANCQKPTISLYFQILAVFSNMYYPIILCLPATRFPTHPPRSLLTRLSSVKGQD